MGNACYIVRASVLSNTQVSVFAAPLPEPTHPTYDVASLPVPSRLHLSRPGFVPGVVRRAGTWGGGVPFSLLSSSATLLSSPATSHAYLHRRLPPASSPSTCVVAFHLRRLLPPASSHTHLRHRVLSAPPPTCVVAFYLRRRISSIFHATWNRGCQTCLDCTAIGRISL